MSGRQHPGKEEFPVAARIGTFIGEQGDKIIQVLVVLALFSLWEAVGRAKIVHPFLLPPLTDVLGRIGGDMGSGKVFVDLGLTLYRTLLGFFIAAAIAIPLGILMARSAAVKWFFDPLISVGFPMPKIAFLPIFILWFDIYDTSKVIMVVFTCVFPIVASAYAGTLAADKWPVWSARSLGASPGEILREVVLPMALPQILTGLQIALPVGLITMIATEMLMGGRGIGGAMIEAGRFADSVGVFAGIVEIAVFGMAVIRSLEWVRARLLVWHPETRRR
jgi:taurine transport system permease protein